MALYRSDLMALARKYRLLAELRRSQLQEVDPGPALRQLARQFPGALRELDVLPLEEIERRLVLLRQAAAGARVEPWMEWMQAYHSTWRAALVIKRRLGGRRRLEAVVVTEIVETLRAEGGNEYDVEFVHAVARPPGGRINSLVFERLAQRFGVPPERIGRALFSEPRR